MSNFTTEEKRNQVIAQCKAVGHMALALHTAYMEYALLFAMSSDLPIVDLVGNCTAALMNELGDILNGMDAVTDEDAWMEPVFHKAHEMFPQAKESP